MGLRTTWICAKGVSKADVLQRFGLVETGEDEGFTIADIAVADLPDGWVVIHYGETEAVRADTVAARFPQGEVIWGTLSETVMCSAAYGMRDGRQVWGVEHDPEENLDGLEVEGAAPAELAAIRERLERIQAEPDNEDVDYVFEAPMQLTKALTGYDPMRQYDHAPFRVVERLASGAAGERQAAEIARRGRMAALIQGEMIPAAAALGFGRPEEIPGHDMRPAPDTVVRVRDGLSEALAFAWEVQDGAPVLAMRFFVRKGFEDRRGRAGLALTPPPKRSLVEWFAGRKEDADAGVDRALREARDLLAPLDRHLRSGAPHPHIRPAQYADG